MHKIFIPFHFPVLCKKVQELQSVISAQKRQQECLLAVICKSLKEEHQAELQGLQKNVAQVQSPSFADKEVWCCGKADTVWSVVTGQTEGGAAAGAGREGG